VPRNRGDRASKWHKRSDERTDVRTIVRPCERDVRVPDLAPNRYQRRRRTLLDEKKNRLEVRNEFLDASRDPTRSRRDVRATEPHVHRHDVHFFPFLLFLSFFLFFFSFFYFSSLFLFFLFFSFFPFFLYFFLFFLFFAFLFVVLKVFKYG
jgi:hypothetical protein